MTTILLHFLITACTWSILALALNLAVGSGGLFNLGHVAFAGVGAYTAVLLEMKLRLPWLLAMRPGPCWPGCSAWASACSPSGSTACPSAACRCTSCSRLFSCS